MTRRRVAIIGAGFSGVAAAVQLLLTVGRARCELLLIERDGRFGPGLAYGAKDKRLLLNARASNMSALAQAPDDFVEWLKLERRRDGAKIFAARSRYGRYVEHVLHRAQRRARGHRLHRIHADAVACRASDAGWRIEFANRKPVEAEAVVLALGNAAATLPASLAQVPAIRAWDSQALKHIPNRADVLLVGAGLTMVDVVMTLVANTQQKGTIYALSRRGLIPRPQVDVSPSPPFDMSDFPASLSEALQVFRREAHAMAARGEPWQWAMERLRPATPELWSRLTLEQQQRFLRHLRPWWDVHRHRSPPAISAAIDALLKSGRLRVLAGEIVAAEANPRGVQILHRQRGSFVRHRLEVGAVVNCTGAALDVAHSGDPLVSQLRGDGLARPHPTGLGFEVAADGRLVGQNGVHKRDLFTLGPPTQGALWESTAVPEIRAQAQALAQILTL